MFLSNVKETAAKIILHLGGSILWYLNVVFQIVN